VRWVRFLLKRNIYGLAFGELLANLRSPIDKTFGRRYGRFNDRRSQMRYIKRLWADEDGQDIAEYAVMLAVILVLVVGTIRLVGSNANNAFSQVASSMNQ
jgi:Flp pilus assembly pilin Flp